MADKYARKAAPPPAQEQAAAILQARLSWPDAERYAAELAEAGVLDSGDEVVGAAVLTAHMPRQRAEALIRDLRMYGAMERANG